MGKVFDTDEDAHTVLQYRVGHLKSRGYTGIVAVDIKRLNELYHSGSVFIATMWITSVILNYKKERK